ncbi:hypothetical protein QQF64_018173 [Cirrhinus molitorella]|uniref:Uncharacterized protein n=1 Tax=Cirrhinus molitorella TaxID=172907 RepID=A0ABR3LMC4_9TELE
MGFLPRHKYAIAAKNIDLMTVRSIRDTLASPVNRCCFFSSSKRVTFPTGRSDVRPAAERINTIPSAVSVASLAAVDSRVFLKVVPSVWNEMIRFGLWF